MHNTIDLERRLKKVAVALFDQGNDDLADDIIGVSRELSARTILGEMPPGGILADLSNLFTDLGIRWAVLGDLAVNVHGQARGTADIDILIETMPPAYKLGDSAYMGQFHMFRTKSYTGTVLNIDSKREGNVEALLADNSLKKWAVATAGNQTILGFTVPVVSAEALVALKVHAMSVSPEKRVLKDTPDVMSVLLRGEADVQSILAHLGPDETATFAKYFSRIVPN